MKFKYGLYHRRKKGPQLAKKAKKAVGKMIKKAFNKNVEIKRVYIYLAQTPTTATAPEVIHLSALSQGTGLQARAGAEIIPKFCHINILFRNALGVAPSPEFQLFRVIVLQWKTPTTGTTPTAAIFLQTSDGIAGAAQVGPGSHYLPYFPEQAVILYDKVWHTEQGTPNASNFGPSGQSSKFVRIKVPMKYAGKIRYSTTGATATSGIYMMILTNSGAANGSTIAYDSVLGYQDA